MAESRSISCDSCGAVVPALGGEWATCVYCLQRTRVPEEFRRGIAAHRAAREEIKAYAGSMQGARLGAGANEIALLLLAAAFVVIPFGAVAPQVDRWGEHESSRFSMALLVIIYGGLAIGFTISALLGRSRRRRLLASLPLARVSVDEGVKLRCGSCGSEMNWVASDIVGDCPSCGVRALVPALLLNRKLRKLALRVVDLRRRGKAIAAKAEDIDLKVGLDMGPPMIVVGVLCALAFLGIPFYMPDSVAHLGPVARYAMPASSAVLMLIAFAGTGFAIRWRPKG